MFNRNYLLNFSQIKKVMISYSSWLFPHLVWNSRVCQNCYRCVKESAWEKLYIHNTQLCQSSCTDLLSCWPVSLEVTCTLSLSWKECWGMPCDVRMSWIFFPLLFLFLLFDIKEASSDTYCYHLPWFSEKETKFIMVLSESISFLFFL